MTARQAVILAAGRGTRLGPLTLDRPKPLLEVGGRPLLLHILDALAGAGIERCTIVVGHLGDLVEREVAAAGVPLSLAFARQEALDGTARALAVARPLLQPGPFLVTWSDVYLEPAAFASLLAAARLPALGALLVNPVDDPWAGAAVYVDGDMRITRIVEKPPPGTSTTPWNNAGPALLDAWVWPFIEALQPSPRGEYELPRALAAAVEAGVSLAAVPVAGPWFDIGTPESLEAARRYAEARRRGKVRP
ncbi:nucleotidyltransferase family protein [Tepidiforma sp.]|uniref:nucleotidyltransferase family protein n=1 Tax=Tepidiforma sp. TaxID=2682230 RepID=UPI002ADE8AF5|nr:nucleotidyltransferase family protein [Tepidiforma sp.]